LRADKYLQKTTGPMTVWCDGTSGNDANDGLSLASAKKTIGGVWALLPPVIDDHTLVILRGVIEDFDMVTLGNIVTPQRTGYAQLIIDGGSDVEVLETVLAGDIHSTTSVGKTGIGWTVDEHFGHWARIDSGPQTGLTFSIRSNTIDTIEPLRSIPDPGAPVDFSIVRPATRLTSSAVFSMLNLSFRGGGGIFFQRITLDGPLTMLQIVGMDAVLSLAGVVIEGGIFLTVMDTALSVNTNLYGLSPTDFASDAFGVLGSYFNGVMANNISDSQWPGLLMRPCPYGGYGGSEMVNSKLKQFDHGSRFIGPFDLIGCSSGSSPIVLAHSGFAPVRFDRSASHGLGIHGGDIGDIGAPLSRDNTSHGIALDNSCAKIGVATGTGNGGAGVHVTRGSHVRLTGAPTITGTVGDVTIDGTTPASTWAAIAGGTPLIDAASEMVTVKNV
jgi:hypothetical protein